MLRRFFLNVLLSILVVLMFSALCTAELLPIQKAVSSSVENGNSGLAPSKAIDNDTFTRWSSNHADEQWIYFDLGAVKEFDVIDILWESAYGQVYDIDISDDAANWQTVYKQDNGRGGEEIIKIEGSKARYVRLHCIRRGTQWGFSIYEFKVIAKDAAAPATPDDVVALSGDNSIVLSWQSNKEDDFYYYNVYRAAEDDQEFKKLNSDPLKSAGYIDEDVSNGEEYYYFVTACDYHDNASEPSKHVYSVPAAIPRKGTYLDASLPLEERVNDLLSRMTLKEKVDQLGGIVDYDDMTSYGNFRLKIPTLKCADGPHGVRWGEGSTAFPVPIAIAASWNPSLSYDMGVYIAKELKGHGRDVSLGPCLNICRDPRAGRSYEGYGEDPYLVGKMATAAVKGLQSEKAISTPKHYACNNIEIGRGGGPVEIDDWSLREIYLPAFKECIQEGQAWGVMGAYNKVNGDYCCENKFLLRDILKDEWGFKGFVISDWNATHSTVKSINSGLDLEMPRAHYYGEPLYKAAKNGIVSEEVIDDAVKRILRTKFWAGLFEEERSPNPALIGRKEYDRFCYEAAQEAIVLLKNDKNILPLNKDRLKTIAVLGPLADEHTCGTDLGSSQINPAEFDTPIEGIKDKISSQKIKITDDPANADVALVFVGLSANVAGRLEGEATDRKGLRLPANQEAVIDYALSKNKNTIVVLIGGSAIATADWGKKAPAILDAWYCGQRGGHAIADVLFGDYNPAGRLPITFPVNTSQIPYTGWNYRGEYKTGVGYQYYDAKKVKPLYCFGHGLSYTKFDYSDLAIVYGDGWIGVSVKVKNIGPRAGDEVVQLYLEDLERSMPGPKKELKGFKRIHLKPSQSQKVAFKLTPDEMALYDRNKNWVVEPGSFRAMVGASSGDIRLSGIFRVVEGMGIVEYKGGY
jgi:beta-glucosidase